jgi:5-oxoprolinase (ATP-hydrolysing) subunit A
MVREGTVRATDGRDVPLRIDTLCTHGDTPGSHELTRALRTALERAGIVVRAVGAPDPTAVTDSPR